MALHCVEVPTEGSAMKISQPKDLGTLVRSRRQQLGLSQTDVAERAGTTRQWLSRFEQGHSDVSLGNAFAILRALGIELGEYVDPATLAVKEPDKARVADLPTVHNVQDEEGTAPQPVSQGDRLRLLRERDALSGLKGWGSKAKPPTPKAEAMPAQPLSTNGASALNTDQAERSDDLDAPNVNDVEVQRAQSTQGGPKYSIDADIARIAKSSLFKRN